MSTYFPSGKDLAANRKWLVVDAAGLTVGHLASEVASILTGKRNPRWTPFMDMGDHVIVVNARKAVLKGAKVEQKVYRRHTLYPGGLREVSARNMLAKHPSGFWNWRLKECCQSQNSERQWRKNSKFILTLNTHTRPSVHNPTS